MKLFVTGANSFIGTELLRACRSAGIHVTGIDLTPAAGDADISQADIRDPAVADLIPQDVDGVIHLAAMSSDPACRNKGYECFDVNVMGTLNMMAAAQARGAGHFVFASSEWVYDSFVPGVEKTEDDVINLRNLNSEYSLSKVVSENNLRQKFEHGFCAATALRFGIVYGSRPARWSAVEALFNSVATQDEVTVGSLKTSRRFIHLSDVAQSIIAAIEVPGFEIINIQGPRSITLADVIETSAEMLGRSPTVKESYADKPSIRPVSSAKAESLMNWRAKTELREGLEELRQFLFPETS